MDDKQIILHTYHSPCGEMLLGSYGDALCLADWLINPRHEQIKQRIAKALRVPSVHGQSSVLTEAIRQLDEYFLGNRQTFDLPLLMLGTDFQREVWEALRSIPYGKTLSYQDLASRINKPKAVRAVAGANAVNAIPILIPCHRVIGHNGTLVGFAGGLGAKDYLLALERGHSPLTLFPS